MNIENIHSLASTLRSIGLEGNVEKDLLQYACFLPAAFTLTRQVLKDKDLVTCSFYFARTKEVYACSYYEVALLKNLELPDRVVASVHVGELDQRMAAIHWDAGEGPGEDVNLQDEATWKREREIEQVVKDLLQLKSGEEGKYFADALKVKHWSYGNVHPLFENLQALRARFEISQRFYLVEGQVISIEEAYRFLLNKWMEKQQYQNRKRPADAVKVGSSVEAAGPVGERSLLPKKSKKRKLKS